MAKSPAAPPDVKIRVRRRPARKDFQVIWRGLNRFNQRVVGKLPYAHFLVEVRSPRGRLLGGLQGIAYYQWLFVANLWLDDKIRRSGVGSRLLAEAERHAERLGCHGVWLDTFAWQARPFYEKHGYQVFGRLPDYPTGHARWFLMKRLAAAQATGRRRRPATPTKSRRA
ncbi:MAG: GNAT family N-acetyltransferase [Alphaproteobacteria bacterium]|nr:GNAT family N-acetyltransferase [Alphaproteobacteria bacterium]